eukprot:2752553-Alexandrium_andersonii.AAC.1
MRSECLAHVRYGLNCTCKRRNCTLVRPPPRTPLCRAPIDAAAPSDQGLRCSLGRLRSPGPRRASTGPHPLI